MKKYLFTVLLAGAVFMACDDPYAGQFVAKPTVNEQGAVLTTDGFTIALGAGFGSAVVLSEENLEENTQLEAVKATATPPLAEGATVTFKLELSATNEFSQVVELPSTNGGNAAAITAGDLNEAVKNLYGKAPEARELFMRIRYYITQGVSSVMMPTPVVLGPVTVTPVGPVIETEYYLIGDVNEWKFENLDKYKFNHSGNDVYEDPIFSILVNDITGNFKIVPKSSKETASWDGVLGNPTDQNTDLTGILEGSGAMRVEETGWVKITLNMMEYTYNIEIIGDMNLTLYVPGSHQNWTPETAPTLYCRKFDFNYDGYVYFDAPYEFKFTSAPNWEGTNYGDGGNGTLSTDGGAGNLSVPEAGYYLLKADLSGSPYTYSVVKTEWGVIGAATPGGWDNSTPMEFSPATGVWSVTTALVSGEFKFRANDGWDINLGGDTNNLMYDGDNLTVSEDGTYLITLNLSDPLVFKATLKKQ